MIALVLLAAAVPACPPDDMTAAPVLYHVVGPGRLPMYGAADCHDAACRMGAYVVPGDPLIGYDGAAGRRCVLFSRAKDTSGWVDGDRLAVDAAAAHPRLADWAGDWRDGDDRIRLGSAPGNRLRVTGDAFWPAAPVHLPRGSPSGWPHTGGLDGTAGVEANRAAYDDGEGESACKVTLRLLGPYLVVADNGNCGGMNVRFSGVYRRADVRR